MFKILGAFYLLAAWFEIFVGWMDLTSWSHSELAFMGPALIVWGICFAFLGGVFLAHD